MFSDPLPFPTEAELLAAYGDPYLPVRVRLRVPRGWHPLRDGREVARYTYTDEAGEPRFQCIRFQLPPEHVSAPDEAFLWHRVDGNGGWAWGLDDVALVPYRLPRVRAAVAAGERVWVVEGEEDVHALEAVGLTSTCNPLGALQWTEVHGEALRGAEAVVIPGRSRAGRVHAARVMASLRGTARSARLLLLPDLEDGEEVRDWMAREGDPADLERLAGAAPRDPSPGELASLLRLPGGLDPLGASPEEVRALLLGADAADASPFPHPAFGRTAAAFARMGVPLPRPGVPLPPDAGVPAAHATYRAVTATLRRAEGDAAARLEDASLLDRAAYELGVLSGLLCAAMAGEPPAEPVDARAPDVAFGTAPSARVLRTRWDWEAFLGDPALAVPPETGAAYLFHLAPHGPPRMRRLHPLPAILLELCARPRTRAEAAAAVAERVDGDPGRVAALAAAQMDELAASGLLRPCAADPADGTLAEMRRLLTTDAPAPSGARGIVGMLSRGLGAVRGYAAGAARAGGGPYPTHILDVSVGMLDDLLARARVRAAFAAELDGYWAGADVAARVGSLTPLLDALGRALGGGAHALPPYVLAE